MTTFEIVLALIIGCAIGRVYGWMKYHYPEFQEEMNLRVAEKKLRRVRIESEIEAHRADIDELLAGRIQ